MRKSLILILTAIGGSASYATAITAVGKEPGVSDPATWRWHVSSILADQTKLFAEPAAAAGNSDTGSFDQRYQRYSPLGLPEPRRDHTP